MAATRRHESEEYVHAMRTARECRIAVGEALGAMVAESDVAGSRSELTDALGLLLTIERRIEEAKGRRRQAYEMGLPQRPALEALHEQEGLKRVQVMAIAAIAGRWAAAIDYEEQRARDPKLNGLGATQIKRTSTEV